MAGFSADLQSFRSSSFPFMETDNPNVESVNQFAGLNPSSTAIADASNLVNFQSFLPFSAEALFGNQAPDFPPTFPENFLGIFQDSNQNAVMPIVSQPCVAPRITFNNHETKKRKSMEVVSESSSGISAPSPPVSDSGSKRKQVSNQPVIDIF